MNYRLRWERPEAGPLFFELKAGHNRIGRDPQTDVPIDDATVSDPHCELEVELNQVLVRDLGSTNGTQIDGELVQTAVLQPGQRLQVGQAMLVLEWGSEALARSNPASVEPALESKIENTRACCANHVEKRATWVCTECGLWLCGACVKQIKLEAAGTVTLCRTCDGLCQRVQDALNVDHGPKNFGTGLIEALGYPLRGNALFVVISVTFFAALSVGIQSANPAVHGPFRFGSVFALASGIAGYGLALGSIGIGAYVLAFFREVLLSSVRGEPRPPNWPDLDLDAMRETVLEFMVWGLVCFGPSTLWTIFAPAEAESTVWIRRALFLLGFVYGAMALLAVVVYDSLAALNPLVVGLSVARVPVRYATFCAFIGGLVLAKLGIESALARAGFPNLSLILGSGFSVYVVLAGLRALGWFYRCSEGQLGWG